MSTLHTTSSLRIPVELLEKLDTLVETLNDQAGVKIWTRNKLIVKAIEDYYFKAMLIPTERRKSSSPVDQNRRKQDDRRRKENITCASFASDFPSVAEGGR